MDSSGLLIGLVIVCFSLFIIRTIMIAYRFYMLKQLKELSQGGQADISSETIFGTTQRMAPVAAAAVATAAVTATTAATLTGLTSTAAPIVRSSYNTTNTTASPDYNGGYQIYEPAPDYVYFYSGYAFYIVLLVLFVIMLPFAIIMSSVQRKRQENVRRLVLQRERARREMEITIGNNNTGNGDVIVQSDNDITILPKGMDLPPSYDELNISNNLKDGNLGASTVTITTDLECSNPNLVAALNEPPPDYQGTIDIVETPAAATTISTTTVVSVTPRI